MAAQRPASLTHVECHKSQKTLIFFFFLDLVPLSWTPFLEKGLPKITEGNPFDPNWPTSRINPAGIEALVNGKYRCLSRVTDNFFVGTGLGKFSFPLRVRLTAITGEQIETVIPDITNNFSFPSNVQFKGINDQASKL